MSERYRGNTVVVVDAGGRGSALVDKYAQSEHVKKVIAIPGNDMMKVNNQKPVEIFPNLKTTDVSEILEICEDEGVDLVDVAQDNAVEAGLVDALTKRDVPVVGPTRKAGQIEWDKAWAREFGNRHDIAQPGYKICLDQQEGFAYIQSQDEQPWFVKASGLTEGKGALPAKNNKEALGRIKEMDRFDKSGKVFLIENWLAGDDGSAGEEFSTFVFSDGEHYQIIGNAQDHKRVFNFDQGENTGGMGCSTPPLVLTTEIMQKVKTEILDKTVSGLKEEGRPYKGILYLGGMLVKRKNNLDPFVIEFNARWGDPEAQVILSGLKNDLFELGMQINKGNISDIKLQTDNKSRVVVTAASKGYPGDYHSALGKRIYGLEEVMKNDNVKVYGAGVKIVDNKYYVNGGRLFYIVGEGESVLEAREKAYSAIGLVDIEGDNLHFRKDIGWRDLQRLNQ